MPNISNIEYNYKNKQFGGNVNISGPNIIGYFTNKKLNKKINIRRKFGTNKSIKEYGSGFRD